MHYKPDIDISLRRGVVKSSSIRHLVMSLPFHIVISHRRVLWHMSYTNFEESTLDEQSIEPFIEPLPRGSHNDSASTSSWRLYDLKRLIMPSYY